MMNMVFDRSIVRTTLHRALPAGTCRAARAVLLAALLGFLLFLPVGLTGCGSLAIDTTAPSSPLLTVGNASGEGIRLIWSGSYDDTGVVSYHLFRDGKRIAIAGKTEYVDKGITEGAKYAYEVVALDAAGNESDRSAAQYVTVPDASGRTDGNSDAGGNAGAEAVGGPLNIQEISKSTVKIYIIDNDYNIVGTGSGTVLDRDGFILTNAHCVEDENGLFNADGYVGIALTDDVRSYSQPQYLARVMSRDSELDLAVVKLAANLDGSALRAMPALVPAAIGDADSLLLGEDVNVLGFPGVGGETITFTSGKVSGFIDEDQDGRTDWIKTDALVNHGNSGGTAVNGKGRMIGVPTAKIGGEDNDQMFFLRPVNLAADVIADAGRFFASGGTGEGNDAATRPAQTAAPSPGASRGNAVAVSGTILDADTGKPLPGAVFIVLEPQIGTDAWLENQDDGQVASVGEADRDGWFETAPEFAAGGSHGVIVWLEGYEMIAIDEGISFKEDESGIYDIGEVFLTGSP